MAYKLTRYHHPLKFRKQETGKQHILFFLALAVMIMLNQSKNYTENSIESETLNESYLHKIAYVFLEMQTMKVNRKITKLNTSLKVITILLIILSNDISLNPGPAITETCSMCNQATNDENSMKCETCSTWCHIVCSQNKNRNNPNEIANTSFEWICPNNQCKPNHQITKNQQDQFSPNRFSPPSQEDTLTQGSKPQNENRMNNGRCKSRKKLKTDGQPRKKDDCKSSDEKLNKDLLNELPNISSKDYQGKDLCRSCFKQVTTKQQAVFCDHCEMWIHRSCSDMLVKIYNKLKKKIRFAWVCNKCRKDDIIIKEKPDKSKLSKEQMPESVENIQKTSKELLIIHLNCRSLVNKEVELQYLIDEMHPDLICLTETWFDESIPSNAFVPEGYSIIRKDRDDTFKQKYGRNRGGGIAILHKKHIKVEKKTYLTDKVEEILWVQVKTRNSFMLGTIYRAEYTDILKNNSNESILEENIRKAAELTKNIIITGDFNVDMSDEESNDTQTLKETYESYNLEQHILKPTRIDKKSLKPTIIDHIWASSDSNLIKATGTFDGISDHMGIYMKLNQKTPNIPDSKIIFRNYKKYSAEEFCKELAENLETSNIEEHLRSNNVHLATDELIKTIQDTAQKHAPVVEINSKIKKKSIPWFTNELKSMIKNKNELIQDYLTSGLKSYKGRIKRMCNNINYLKRQLKKTYINDQLDKANGNSKEVWKVYNQTTQRTKVKETIEPDMMNQQKADKFNTFFATIGVEIQKKLTKSNQPQHNTEDTLHNTEDPPRTTENPHDTPEDQATNQPTFQFKPEQISNIEKIIDNIRNEVAIGEDMIGAKLIKDMKNIISPILTKIINKCYETNSFPNSMKHAAIKPIHKKGNTDEISNYRPISILPTLSKIFEKAAANQIVHYLESNKLLHRNQHAYQKLHSTITCLIELLTYVYSLIDKKKLTAIISLDLSKAFDSIDHKLLLKKLLKLRLGENAVQWVKSYPTNRKQITKFKKFKSSEETVHSGIPQGSIVGPLLFLCYTNDFHEELIKECQTYAYADDTQMVIEATNLKQLKKKAEAVISLARKWYQNNIMKNNIGKTEIIVINTKLKQQKNEKIKITVKDEGVNVTITSKPFIEILGVIIDHNLNWTQQVNKVKKKAFNITRNIHRINHLLPMKHKLNLYHAVISPQFSYADTVWGGCNQKEKLSLQKIQNFAAKSITGNRKYDSATNSLNQLKLLNLQQRLTIHETVLVHKALQGKSSENINSLYKSHLSTANTRQATNLKLSVPAHKTAKYERSPLFRSITSWNSCPNTINTDNIKQHKKQLQNHMINLNLNKKL